ncbi:cupin domain-containing protein [Nonomuraea sp. NPDC049309]|uniref:AraC family transcriptional regulator n=1 Tax=Nonomuraea sp. NPDC049309 TaxID=3364350 RepID=UPI0037157E8B
MDVVSDAISAVHLGHPLFDRVGIDGSWSVRLDPYDGAGFHVVLKGACRLRTDNGTDVSLNVGDAVLLPHGTGHVLADSLGDLEHAVPFEQWPATAEPRRHGATELLCGKYRLDCSRMHPLMTELPEVVHLPSRVGTHLELRAAIDLLAVELDEVRPGSSIALPHLLDLLLVYMIRAWMSQTTSGAWPSALGDPVTAAALRAMHARPAAPWTIDRLAAEAGVSRPTLARRFTALVGRPPMAYLTWWRVIKAASLLRDTQDTLAAIAERVGYSSPYALSHAFEREFGTTPGRYRELVRSGGSPTPAETRSRPMPRKAAPRP